MSYNGSGTFQINTTGQPVVTGTVISSTAFNALTADLATGLSTAITKDGQTATTARIPFAAGINSTLVTDSTSTSTGSIITAGGVGVAKALYVGTTANIAGTSTLTGTASLAANLTFTGTGNRILGDFSNATLANRVMFQTSTASSGSNISIIPNGTVGAGAGTANLRFEDSTSIATGNGSFGNVTMVQDTDFRISSTRVGTGTYRPMTFYTGGSESARIDTSGNLLVGTTVTLANSTFVANQGVTARTATASGTTPFLQLYNGNATTDQKIWRIGAQTGGSFVIESVNDAYSSATSRLYIDTVGNILVPSGAVMPYAPAPTGIAAATTLTNAQIQGQIISATGTTYTITMPLGTTMETLATWATTNIAYDFFVINTATGVITMAVNTGVTSLGSLTVAIGASAHFRIRRTAANTFVLYRLV